jgi:hypothetical protein
MAGSTVLGGEEGTERSRSCVEVAPVWTLTVSARALWASMSEPIRDRIEQGSNDEPLQITTVQFTAGRAPQSEL